MHLFSTICLFGLLFSPMDGSVLAKIEAPSESHVVKVVSVEFEQGDEKDVASRPRSTLLAANLLILLYSCECVSQENLCQCCLNLHFFTDKKCCIKLHYSIDNFTIYGKAECGNTTVMNFITSASTEKDVECFNATNLPFLLGVCLQLHNVRLDLEAIRVCSRLEIAVARKVVYNWKLGCLSMGGADDAISSEPSLLLDTRSETVHLNMTLAEARAESHRLL